MTRKSKRYQLLIITLLLCFIQVAGIDVYAQAPVTPVQKDLMTLFWAFSGTRNTHDAQTYM